MIRDPRGRSVDFGPPQGRALSQFIAVSARPMPWHSAAALTFLGLCIGSLIQLSPVTAAIGAATGLAVGLVMPAPGQGVIEQLDRKRKAVGLDQFLGQEKLKALEPAALEWERIDNAMQSQAWLDQPEWRERVTLVAKKTMEQTIAATLKNRKTSGLERIKALALAVDRVTSGMGAYNRPEFDSTGVPIGEGQPEVAELARQLRDFEAE